MANGQSTLLPVQDPLVPPAPVVWFGSSAANHIYITMDDGWVRNEGVIAMMKRDNIPITTFLIQDAAQEDPAFWQSFVAAGGTIEDHTINHPDLTKVSAQQAEQQWAAPAVQYQSWFHEPVTIGRPPYGSLDKTVQSAATAAGLRAVVMWSAEFTPGNAKAGLQTYDGRPLRAGEIVLLHWENDTVSELKTLLAVCKANGLTPAPLLPGIEGQIKQPEKTTVQGMSTGEQ